MILSWLYFSHVIVQIIFIILKFAMLELNLRNQPIVFYHLHFDIFTDHGGS